MYGGWIVRWKEIVYAHLRALKVDICFLQEMHIKKTAAKVLCSSWASQVYQSDFSTKARGVAILIRKILPFIHFQTISDQRGRYLIVRGELNSIPLTLVNLYGPNFDDLFLNLFNIIPNLSDSNVILDGDFNCILDSILDRQRSHISSLKSSGTLNNLMHSYNLVDIWRLLYPTKKFFLTFPQCINPILGSVYFC